MVQILIIFARIILDLDKNGIFLTLKTVKSHLKKQNAFLSKMVERFLIALSEGIVTFLKKCLFPGFISTMIMR